jgi:hypothetical protein
MAYPIEIESETLQYEGEWFTREELAHKIRTQLEAGDYNVVQHAQALDYLVHTLASLRVLSLKVMPEMLEKLNQEAARQSRSVGGIVRDALAAHLGISPPDKAAAVPTLVTAPPQLPGRRPTDPEIPSAELFDADTENMPLIDDLKGPKTREMPSVVVDMEAVAKPGVAFAPVPPNGKQH